MHSNAHFLKDSHTGIAGPRFAPEAFCIHCFRSLGARRNALQRAKAEAKHICPEKRLAWQPAAPPPYN
jgi:hypothetical protein